MFSTTTTSLFNHHNHFHHQYHRRPLTPKFITIIKSASSNLQETQHPDNGNESLSWQQIALPPVKAAKRVVLVRHGQSTWNAEGRIQGSSNFSVLTQKGESQADTSRQMLIHDTFDICFASPLNRSKRTAEIIWSNRKGEIITDSNLREIDLYSFQGLLKKEGKDKYGEVFSQWQVDPANFNIDGHYPVKELWSRARSCWTKILTHESRSILVVAHNAVNQALLATAIGLDTNYFRALIQSNCGVSVLDFTPQSEGESPYICLNRLNQTPGSPIAGGSSGGRKTSKQIILVCHGSSPSNLEAQKTAELLLDLKVTSIISDSKLASFETAAKEISQLIPKVQEAADSVPRYVEIKQIEDFDVYNILKQSNKDVKLLRPLESGWLSRYEDSVQTALWNQSGKAWEYLMNELSRGSSSDNVVVSVGYPALHIAMLGQCLNLSKEWLGKFHLDAGSVSVIDFPDGPSGRGVIRCLNYTAHLGRWSVPITTTTREDQEF